MIIEDKSITDNEFKQLLSETTNPGFSPDFANRVMMQVEQVSSQKNSLQLYKRLAWIFAALAVVFSVKVVMLYTSFQAVFAKLLNSLLPGLSDSLVYLGILAISGIILYELNLLMMQRFSKKSESLAFK
jgi:hypothetical protein